MKPMPLGSACRVEIETVFGSSNRVRMKKLCPFEVFKEHGKNCRCGGHKLPRVNPVSVDMAGGTHKLMWQKNPRGTHVVASLVVQLAPTW